MCWEDLAYDLRLTAQTAEENHIFCLEASVDQGFLPRLINFDFSQSVEAFPEQVEAVRQTESRLMMLSSMLSYPSLLIIGVVVLLGLLIFGVVRLVKRARR